MAAKSFGRRRRQHALHGREIGDVGRDCDVVAPVVGDVVGHVAAGTRLDRGSAFRLALQPTVDVGDGMGDDDSGHSVPFVRHGVVWIGRPYYTGSDALRVSARFDARLQARAVPDDEAEQKDCQCRNWPDHEGRIDPGARELNPPAARSG